MSENGPIMNVVPESITASHPSLHKFNVPALTLQKMIQNFYKPS